MESLKHSRRIGSFEENDLDDTLACWKHRAVERVVQEEKNSHNSITH